MAHESPTISGSNMLMFWSRKLQESVERPKVTKQKLRDFGATKFDLLHVDNSINWLNDCNSKNNEHGEKSQRFAEFNRTIDEPFSKDIYLSF